MNEFCDAAIEAYSALAYARLWKNDVIARNLVTAKSKIVPSEKLTVPRLELMPCLLLLRLILSVKKALSVEVNITKVVCCSDSKVTLWWIKFVNKKWKMGVKKEGQKIEKILT